MPEKPWKPSTAVIGIDIGKNSFHVVGLDRNGAIVLRQKWSRNQIHVRLAKAHLPDRSRQVRFVPKSRHSASSDPTVRSRRSRPPTIPLSAGGEKLH